MGAAIFTKKSSQNHYFVLINTILH